MSLSIPLTNIIVMSQLNDVIVTAEHKHREGMPAFTPRHVQGQRPSGFSCVTREGGLITMRQAARARQSCAKRSCVD